MYRFCFPCKTGFQPDQLACALCSHTGGAYKKLAGDDKSWVHALCVNWIPEVFEIDGDIDKMGPRVNLSTLDKARLRLNCNFCSRKGGACVQCAYKKCQSAIHPMCLVKDSFDFTFRVVEGKNKKTQCDYYRREAFCPRHADFAGEPLKKDEIVIQVLFYSICYLCFFFVELVLYYFERATLTGLFPSITAALAFKIRYRR